jgi:hypothetical protein
MAAVSRPKPAIITRMRRDLMLWILIERSSMLGLAKYRGLDRSA